ncbi:uncharacterized protein LOC114240165 [Bombyx mandarina]|uniref:Uncharacterized protein LOC114240165 n=1 Tax=Bombyx mandarina TaxID=7092 RepID=A0A6J2JAT2_BOMMA|nr:uncharacterized protein LOC114240165 [Bombyx mandarina]
MFLSLLLFLGSATCGLCQDPIICAADNEINKNLDKCVKELIPAVLATEKALSCSTDAGHKPSPMPTPSNNNNTICSTIKHLNHTGEHHKANSTICSFAKHKKNENLDAFVDYIKFVLSPEKICEFHKISKNCIESAKKDIEICAHDSNNSTKKPSEEVHLRNTIFTKASCVGKYGISTVQNCVKSKLYLKECSNDTIQYVDSLFNQALVICENVRNINTNYRLANDPSPVAEPLVLSLTIKILLITATVVILIALVVCLIRRHRNNQIAKGD